MRIYAPEFAVMQSGQEKWSPSSRERQGDADDEVILKYKVTGLQAPTLLVREDAPSDGFWKIRVAAMRTTNDDETRGMARFRPTVPLAIGIAVEVKFKGFYPEDYRG